MAKSKYDGIDWGNLSEEELQQLDQNSYRGIENACLENSKTTKESRLTKAEYNFQAKEIRGETREKYIRSGKEKHERRRKGYT